MAKFHYFYQSKENQNLEGWISAKSRDDVYAQLRKAGIKPYKVIGKNPLAWKRWAAIAVLAAALSGTYAWLAFRPRQVAENESIARHQIYGAESVIRNGVATDWTVCGLDVGERFLAKYAQPGVPVAFIRTDLNKLAGALEASLSHRLQPLDDELLEYRQIRQIVEVMKEELRAYIANGGTARLYIDRLQERQSQEVAYYRAAAQELTNAKTAGASDDDLYTLWSTKNSELRAIGLPMLKDPLNE